MACQLSGGQYSILYAVDTMHYVCVGKQGHFTGKTKLIDLEYKLI